MVIPYSTQKTATNRKQQSEEKARIHTELFFNVVRLTRVLKNSLFLNQWVWCFLGIIVKQ